MTESEVRSAQIKTKVREIWIEERKKVTAPIIIRGMFKPVGAEHVDIEYNRLKVFDKMMDSHAWKEVLALLVNFEVFESKKFGNFDNPIFIRRDEVIELLNSI